MAKSKKKQIDLFATETNLETLKIKKTKVKFIKKLMLK